MDKALKNHALSSLHSLFHLLTLLLCISIEAQVFLKKHNPIYHLLPLSISILLSAFLPTSKPIYLLDFSCLTPHPRLRIPTATFLEHLPLIAQFPDESIAFMSKILTTSGLGEETAFPPSLLRIPPHSLHRDSIAESHALLFPILDDLLSRTDLSPRDIDVLVLNCSGFSPAPSLSSLIVNRYAMRDDVKTFNVSGMGCGAGAVAVDIASSLLKRRCSNYSYAVVVSTEILSTGWYAGRDRRKLLINCFFRTGSSAVLLTNVREERRRSKYKLVNLVRTSRAFDDRAYRSAVREEDSEGATGFSIEPYLPEVAADMLRDGLGSLGMLVLPVREKLRYMMKRGSVPDFGSVVRHYCLPASGRVVMEEIGRGLGLKEEEMEAAVETFRRFGNQSSASMWYQLAYLEGKRRVKRGDRVLQLGMGSGPKCNSMVWERLRGVEEELEQDPSLR